MPLFRDGFLGGAGCRSLFGRRSGCAAQQGTRLLQLGDFPIYLCQNFRNSHGSSYQVFVSDPIPVVPESIIGDERPLILRNTIRNDKLLYKQKMRNVTENGTIPWRMSRGKKERGG